MTQDPVSNLGQVDEQFARIADNAPVMIWIVGPDKKYRWFNAYRSRFTGLPVEEELRTDWLERIHPEDRETCATAFNAAFDSKRPLRMEYRLLHVSGEYRWIFTHGIPNFDGNGEFLGFVGSCTDVQDLKSAKCRLQRDHEFLERLIDVGDRESEAVSSALHDRVLQPLLAAKMHIQSLAATDADAMTRTANNVELASRLLSDVADECLQIIKRTRPLIIDEQGTQAAIHDLLVALNEKNETHFALQVNSELGRLPRLWEGSLYWIVAEALENVVQLCRCATVRSSLYHVRIKTNLSRFKLSMTGRDSNRCRSCIDDAFGLKAIEEPASCCIGRSVSRSELDSPVKGPRCPGHGSQCLTWVT